MVAIGKKNNVFSRVEELGIPKKKWGRGELQVGGELRGGGGYSGPGCRSPCTLTVHMIPTGRALEAQTLSGLR